MPAVPEAVLSHWSKLVEGFKTSSLDFYAQVEQALKVREMPDIEVSRVEWSESGVLSARRQYLRVRRGSHAFDICAAPFGSGYFFSWWLAAIRPAGVILYFAGVSIAMLVVLGIGFAMLGFLKGLLFVFFAIPGLLAFLGWGVREKMFGSEETVLAMPGVGWLYERLFAPPTYYRLDTAAMFRESVSSAVNEVLGTLLKEQGLRALSQDDLRPSIRDLAGS